MPNLKDPHGKMPLKRSILWIFVSSFLVLGSATGAFIYYKHMLDSKMSDPGYNIIAVVQTSNEAEPLKTLYLTELMELSIDKPSNLYSFNCKEAQKKLLKSPLLKTASVKKIKPGTIYVDYTVRKPIAYLGDYTNTGIDDEGVAIPFTPFFTPKNLPEIFIGAGEGDHQAVVSANQKEESGGGPKEVWGSIMRTPEVCLGIKLLKIIQSQLFEGGLFLKKIDVSKAFSSSWGRREIIVVLEDKVEDENGGRFARQIYPRYLRLSTENYQQELANFLVLREHLLKKEQASRDSTSNRTTIAPEMVIDLRIPHLAFIGT